jgi:hypothetical protein
MTLTRLLNARSLTHHLLDRMNRFEVLNHFPQFRLSLLPSLLHTRILLASTHQCSPNPSPGPSAICADMVLWVVPFQQSPKRLDYQGQSVGYRRFSHYSRSHREGRSQVHNIMHVFTAILRVRYDERRKHNIWVENPELVFVHILVTGQEVTNDCDRT